MRIPTVSRQLAVLLFLLGGPLAGQTSLSIYSDGRVVVRRVLPQSLEKGRNALTLPLDEGDLATLFSPDTSVTVVTAVMRPPTERGAALELAVGQTLAFVRAKGDTVRATVVRATPPQYRLADGRLLLIEPGEPLFPPEGVRTAPQASLVLEATRARSSTELAYVTEGARWFAVYQAVLGAGRASVSGAATVTSQRVRAANASVQLVAGTIGRVQGRPSPKASSGWYASPAIVAREQELPNEQAVGETHVYGLAGRMTLEPGVPVTTALFPRAVTAITQELIVPGALPFRGYLASSPNQAEPDRVPVQVWYTLARPRGSAFGERPLPGGTMQIYEADSAGRVQLIGEAATAHTAPGRDLRVQSGDAFDVTAERVQTDYQQEQIPPTRRGLPVRQRFTGAYRVTVRNAKSVPVTVDVRETRGGEWVVVASSLPAEKLSAAEVRFRVAVPAKGEATLTYTVQVDS